MRGKWISIPQGGSSIITDCISGYTAGVHNWSSACANNEDQVHDTTGYHACVQRRVPAWHSSRTRAWCAL
jgi:hypothetical protein